MGAVCENSRSICYQSTIAGFLALGPVSSKNCCRIAIKNPNTPKKSRPSFKDPVSLSIQPTTSGAIKPHCIPTKVMIPIINPADSGVMSGISIGMVNSMPV